MIEDEDERSAPKRTFFYYLSRAEVVISLVVGLVGLHGILGVVAASNGTDDAGLPPPLVDPPTATFDPPTSTLQPPVTTMPPPPPPPPPPARTKAEYITEADSLCLASYQENFAAQQADRFEGAKASAQALEALAGNWARVERPPGDEEVIEGILDLLRQSNYVFRQSINYYLAGDSETSFNYFQESERLKNESMD